MRINQKIISQLIKEAQEDVWCFNVTLYI